MKNSLIKRILCLSLALVFALSLAACGGSKDGKNGSDKKGSDAAKDDKKTSGGITASVEDKEVLESKLAKADFGDESFVFYFTYEYGDIVDRKVSEFNKQHNAKVEAKTISGTFTENIAKSIASGSPYDMIANHSMRFPQTIFSDIYEPLGSYIEEIDYFDAAKPANGGISKTVNAPFYWNNKLYACGSAKAVYQEVMFYNKRLFQDAGLEDPLQLWRNGNWTWDKYLEMGKSTTDLANNIAFLCPVDVTMWWNVSGVAPVIRTGDSFKENLSSTEITKATQDYYNLYFGDEPISVPNTSIVHWQSGKAYTWIGQTDSYSQYADTAKKSGSFSRNAANLGVVPMPTGLCADGKYPGHAAQGYSAAKGAKRPDLAPAYALFESRTKDSDIGSTMQMPAEIRNYVEEEFAKNGYMGFESLSNSEGQSYREYFDKEVGQKIKNDGADPVSALNNARPMLTRMINDSTSASKGFKG